MLVGLKRYQITVNLSTCGLLDSSAELATASNPTYEKNTTVAPVNIALEPFGEKGVQFETSTSKAPTQMTIITITTCSKVGLHKLVQLVSHIKINFKGEKKKKNIKVVMNEFVAEVSHL